MSRAIMGVCVCTCGQRELEGGGGGGDCWTIIKSRVTPQRHPLMEPMDKVSLHTTRTPAQCLPWAIQLESSHMFVDWASWDKGSMDYEVRYDTERELFFQSSH